MAFANNLIRSGPYKRARNGGGGGGKEKEREIDGRTRAHPL